MKTSWLIVILMAALCPLVCLAQDASTQPAENPAGASAAPSTRPESSRYGNYRRRNFERRSTTPDPVAPALPAIFEAVAARNIFIKGDQRPPPVQTISTPPVASGPYTPTATQLVLTGISLEDKAKVAFLEDQQAYTVTRVKIGDPVADGKVVNMSLDALDYKDSHGNIIRVTVGFNLAGGDVWGVSGSPSSGSSTQPVSSGPRAPGESMEDYLKRRRAAELNH